MRKVPKFLLAGLIVLAGLWTGTTRINAEDGATSASLSTAPAGLNQLDKLLTLPGTFHNGIANSASIQNVTNSAAPNTQAIQIINGKKQLGGFWANDDNRIDLNQDTTLKMWVYLGSSTSTSKAGDGMAFVMQNDPNGTSAAANLSSGNIIGETLGTWGVDTNNKQEDPQGIAATAIQNSWALEFDTYLNKSTSYSDAGKGDAFDANKLKGQHMATGYPGVASQYTSKSVNNLLGIIYPTRYYFEQVHTNLADNLSLGNSQWHHLVLKWDAASKTMTYTFDDINPDGSANAGVFTKSEAIDTSQFNSSDGLVRWGFMGATGSNSGANMVVLESVPNLVQASAAVKVTDTTKDKEVASGAKVKAKHKLQYDYKLTYEGGRQDWDNIEADLKLPDNVTFDKAVVKYADGTEQTLDAPAGDTKEVTYQLQSALSSSNPTATITLSGQADNVKINSDTTETTSIFKNRTFETTTTAPNYTITVDQPIEAHFLRAETTVDNGKDATVYGLVIAEGSEQISNSSITIHPTLNGQELDSFKMSDADESGLFIIKIKADQLNVGENKLTAWASDFDDNESEVTETKITVRSGELGFKTVAATSTFKPITLNGQAQTADRNNDWALVVSDERGKGSSWQLQASVSDFTSSDGRKLPGNVLYKQGDQTTVLNGDGTLIDTHTTTSDADNYDVVKDWSNDSGILYKTNAAATPGSYSGKVTWTLTNAPN